jgi:hypothetical protein
METLFAAAAFDLLAGGYVDACAFERARFVDAISRFK